MAFGGRAILPAAGLCDHDGARRESRRRLKANRPRGEAIWERNSACVCSQIGIFFISHQLIVINNFRGSSSEGGCGQDWPPHGATELPVFYKGLLVRCTSRVGRVSGNAAPSRSLRAYRV